MLLVLKLGKVSYSKYFIFAVFFTLNNFLMFLDLIKILSILLALPSSNY